MTQRDYFTLLAQTGVITRYKLHRDTDSLLSLREVACLVVALMSIGMMLTVLR